MRVSEFLAQCRDELFKGWTKGSYHAGQSVCAVGAIERVAFRNLPHIAVAGKAQQEINLKSKEVYGQEFVQTVNDSLTTSHQDMLDLFDKTILSGLISSRSECGVCGVDWTDDHECAEEL